MKRIIFILAWILIYTGSWAQSQFPSENIRPVWNAQEKVSGLFWIATTDTIDYPASNYPGAISYRSDDSSLYVSDGHGWHPIASGLTAVTGVTNNKDSLFVNTSDGDIDTLILNFYTKDSLYTKSQVDSLAVLKVDSGVTYMTPTETSTGYIQNRKGSSSYQDAQIQILGNVKSTGFTSIVIDNPSYRFQPPLQYSAWQMAIIGMPAYDGSNTGATFYLQRILDDSSTATVMTGNRASGAIRMYDSLTVDSSVIANDIKIKSGADTGSILVSIDASGKGKWVSRDSLLDWNKPGAIEYPDDFTFRPFSIYYDGAKAVPSVDIPEKINSLINTLTPYYVDPINGDDDNTGLSWSESFKTINKAVSGSSYKLVYLKGGWYTKEDFDKASNTASYINKDTLIMIGAGDVHLTGYESPKSYSWAAFSSYCWYTLLDSVGTVVDYRTLANDGLPTRYKLVDNWTEVKSMNATWFASNDTLYVHPADNAIPNSLIKISRASYKLFDFINSKDTGFVYFKNISFEGQQVSFTISHASTIVSGLDVMLNNCSFSFSPSAETYDHGYGLYTNAVRSVYTYNCTAYKNDGDGLHYENGTVAAGQYTNVIEYGDRLFDNGNYDLNFSTVDLVNGSSVHDACNILRINSSAWNNRGPNFSDISTTSKSMFIGCSAFNSTATDNTRNSDFDVSEHTMWLFNCQSYGSIYGAYILGHGTGLEGTMLQSNCKLLNGAKLE